MTEYKKVFLDTAPFIYFLDSDERFGPQTCSIFESILQSRGQMISSTITCEEYLVYPYRTNNREKVNAFFDFVNDIGIPLYPIDTEIAKIAAAIRAQYKDFKGMDALQLAVACSRGCDAFLTNDRQLRQFKELPCITIDEWVINS